MFKPGFTALLLLTMTGTADAQIKWLPGFVNRMYFHRDSSRGSSFAVLPILTSAPETGLELGAAGLYSFYSDTARTKATRVSSIYPYASVTTKGQSHISITSTYWTPGNTASYAGGISYINYPFEFYGIGNHTLGAEREPVDEKRFKLNFSAVRRWTANLYAGIVAGGFNYNYARLDTQSGRFAGEPPVESSRGGAAILAGPTLVYDSRDNNTYSTRGQVLTVYFNAMQGLFGNRTYQGGLFNAEYAVFFKLSSRLVAGIDIQGQSLAGGRSPFYLLPALGNDEIMRGYYNGRYRDRNLLAGQTELRYRLSPRLGVVAFAGAGEVARYAFSFAALKPDYGGGIRYFFDLEKGLSIRADYGIGERVPGESRQTGFYIGLGQAF